MKKSHLEFLERAVNYASLRPLQSTDSIIAVIDGTRYAKVPVNMLTRRIVSDPRFFSILEDSFVWRKYCVESIKNFIDSIPDEIWKNKEKLNELTESFLNSWFAKNVLPQSIKTIRQRLQKVSGMSDDEVDKLEKADNPDGIPEVEITKFSEGIYNCSDGSEPKEFSFRVFEAADEEDEEIEDKTVSAGRSPGEVQYEKPEPLKNYDPELQRLAKMIGRGGDDSGYIPGKFLRASKTDIAGVTVGNNLNAVLPTEMALLSSRQTEDIFFDRYVKNRLQVFGSKSMVKGKSKKKDGPIFICVDTSGSMAGEPQRMARSLSYAISIMAQKRGRPVFLTNYSDILSFFVLTKIESQKNLLLKFLSRSYGGGNDENKMFSFLLGELPKSSLFKPFKEQFTGADLLVVSDFEWMPLLEDIQKLLQEARSTGMRFYALGIGPEKHFRQCINCHNHDMKEFMSGYEFYNSCDFKFVYDGEWCNQIRNTSKNKRENGKENATGGCDGVCSRNGGSWTYGPSDYIFD